MKDFRQARGKTGKGSNSKTEHTTSCSPLRQSVRAAQSAYTSLLPSIPSLIMMGSSNSTMGDYNGFADAGSETKHHHPSIGYQYFNQCDNTMTTVRQYDGENARTRMREFENTICDNTMARPKYGLPKHLTPPRAPNRGSNRGKRSHIHPIAARCNSLVKDRLWSLTDLPPEPPSLIPTHCLPNFQAAHQAGQQ
ncbi:hypothetical protein DPMN_168272 [Dreissena polymorpha]|uniref:Uncharacterized protein n=1 Tax=Dreissena polymorpha TaxID=45954 RepID=A0A9D4F1F9_DREPO|nr:hypothetical protein DPMN_168272 [Dreissena polymorpha]